MIPGAVNIQSFIDAMENVSAMQFLPIKILSGVEAYNKMAIIQIFNIYDGLC